MVPGEKKNFVLIPFLGLIEAGNTKEETLKRIERARVDQEIKDKKTLRRLKKEFPNCDISKEGISWKVQPRDQK